MSDFNKHKWIINGLRRLSYKWPPRWTIKQDARVERGKYLCNGCKQIVKAKEVEVDHIEPVIEVTGFVDWNTYIERLLCEKEGYQILCKACHLSKSLSENLKRREK